MTQNYDKKFTQFWIQQQSQNAKFQAPVGYTNFKTNCIFKDYIANILYLPAYMRFKFYNFISLQLQSSAAKINGELLLTVYYGDIEKQQQLNEYRYFQQKKKKNQSVNINKNDKNMSAQKKKKQMMDQFKKQREKKKKSQEDEIFIKLKKQIVLFFDTQSAIQLNENLTQDFDGNQVEIIIFHNHQKKQISYKVKKIFNFCLKGTLQKTPFQLLNAITTIKMQSISMKRLSLSGQTVDWKVQFNLMDNESQFQKIQYSNWGMFGNYDLAQKKVSAIYTNYRINDVQHAQKYFEQTQIERIQSRNKVEAKNNAIDMLAIVLRETLGNKFNQWGKLQIQRSKNPMNMKIEPFHFAHFNIPLYKDPIVAIVTIFAPLFFLDLIAFGIFLQNQAVNDRVNSASVLMLAYVALIPVIKSQIPKYYKTVYAQYLVYSHILIIIFALIQTIIVRLKQSYQFSFKDAYQIVLMSLSIFISSVNFIIVVGYTLYYYLVLKNQYNSPVKRKNNFRFDRFYWKNIECDQYFTKIFNLQDKFDRYIKVVEIKDLQKEDQD